MDFLEIPEEVIIGKICQMLEYNDVLRVRHVNKQLNSYANDHLKVRKAIHEFEINEYDRSLSKFMTLGVCATRIYFNVANPNFFMAFPKEIKKFLEKHGDKISHIRARYFQAFTVEGEMDFYGAFTNLKHLELEEVIALRRFREETRGYRDHNSPFPHNFKQLETLKFGVVLLNRYEDLFYQWDMFNFCEKLEYFKHAHYCPHATEGVHVDEPFGNIGFCLDERRQKFPKGPHLKFYDIGNLRGDDDYVKFGLIKLSTVFIDHGVKLLNVDACLIEQICSFLPVFGVQMCDPITSLKHFSPSILCTTMPNLEVINGTCSAELEEYRDLNRYPEWPKLKTLKLAISESPFDPKLTTAMINHLFNREKSVREREQLTTLSLELNHKVSVKCTSYPKINSIIATCPNLTKLALVNYAHPAPNKAYSELWQGLQFLQEIYIDKCTTLGNAGFVGKNIDKPAFLELKCLKKLTLKGLDKMPKISDIFFKLVLRHMKLSHFVLQSDAPLVSISQDGISSLLTGQFGKFIEKFHFKGWSLSGLSEPEFKLLGSKFRSSHMI